MFSTSADGRSNPFYRKTHTETFNAKTKICRGFRSGRLLLQMTFASLFQTFWYEMYATTLGFNVKIPMAKENVCLINGRDSMGRAGILQINKQPGGKYTRQEKRG